MRQRDEWFGPDAIAPLYRTCIGVPLVVGLGVTIVTTALIEDAPWYVPAGQGGLFAVLLLFFWWWAGAYARAAGYRLTDDEIESRGGVWWQKQATVPYTRITNVEAKQGPITRRLGVGSVVIQTAGKSAQGGAEVTIKGVTDYEELRDQILGLVHDGGNGSDREQERIAGGDGEGIEELLAEVRAIRSALEDR